MTRVTCTAVVAAALLAPHPAFAQLANATALEAGLPASLALPVGGAASAEEPSALTVNPAGVGFVDGPSLQWFHEERVAGSSAADGLYFASAVGPIGGGLAMEWVRPSDGYGARYRKTTLALAFTDHAAWSLALGWSWLASPDPARDALRSIDLGLTVRPWRHLSLAASALGLQARLAGERLPVRYDFGAATRFMDDTFTLSADLLADDRARDSFHVTHGAVGLGVETRFGLGVGLQVQLPVEGSEGRRALVTLAWNDSHAGFTGGVVTRGDATGWITGVRLSSERYRGLSIGGDVPTVDVVRELEPGSTFLSLFTDREPWLDLLQKLERARDDPDVAGLVIRIGALEPGRARTEELRGRIAEIAARKPVLAWLGGGGTKEYLVAAAATAIAVPSGASVLFNGIATEPLYLRDTLARAGIAVEVVRVGAWKSATEPLTRTGGSPEARGAIDAILDDVHARDVACVSTARHLPAARVEELLDRGIFSAEEARAAGLVDEILWPDEIEEWAHRRVGKHVALPGSYEVEQDRRAEHWGNAPALAIVLVEGTIVPGRSRREPLGTRLAGADSVTAALKRVAADKSVRAVVLRIDSGGGDALASELIWREVQQTRKKKPVVVSMGDLAASGGYLAAAGADAIVAEPSTLTGSIGVFAMKPDLSGLLEKAGVQREPHQRGEKALVASLAKPWSPAERAALQAQIDDFYARFVGRVADGRRLSREAVEKVAQGRVWTGRQALERGLVDRLGGLSDAVDLARERAGLPKGSRFEIVRVDAPSGGAGLGGAALALFGGRSTLLESLGDRIPALRALGLLAELGPIVALPPFELEIDR
jgi:protease-4